MTHEREDGTPEFEAPRPARKRDPEELLEELRRATAPSGFTRPAPDLTPAPLEPAPDRPGLESVISAIDQAIDPSASPAATASAPSSHAQKDVGTRHIVFSLSGTHYAVRLSSVVEVGTRAPLTAVPNVPDWMLGLVNLRGDVLAVIDLGLLLDLPSRDERNPDRMLIVRSGTEEMSAGLMVDGIHGVTNIVIEDLDPPAAAIDDQVAPYLLGVQENRERLLAVLDLERLMQSPQVRQFEA